MGTSIEKESSAFPKFCISPKCLEKGNVKTRDWILEWEGLRRDCRKVILFFICKRYVEFEVDDHSSVLAGSLTSH
jgi:hypothetical protein